MSIALTPATSLSCWGHAKSRDNGITLQRLRRLS